MRSREGGGGGGDKLSSIIIQQVVLYIVSMTTNHPQLGYTSVHSAIVTASVNYSVGLLYT